MKELREDVSVCACSICCPVLRYTVCVRVRRRRNTKNKDARREESERERLVEMRGRKKRKLWTLKWLK